MKYAYLIACITLVLTACQEVPNPTPTQVIITNSTSAPTASVAPSQTPEPTPLPGVLTIPLDSLQNRPPWLPLDESKRPTVVFIGVNNSLAPFNNVNVRKAFAAATDREAIAAMAERLYFDNVRPATNLTPSETIGRDLYEVIGIPYNTEAALEYLTAAGYSDPSHFPVVVLMGSVRGEAPGFYEQVAQRLATMWEENLGVQVEVQIIGNFSSYIDRLGSEAPHLYLLGWGADENDPENFLGSLFRSESQINFSRFHNSGYDRLVNSARNLANAERRQLLYLEAEWLLTQEEAGVIPLFHSYFYRGN